MSSPNVQLSAHHILHTVLLTSPALQIPSEFHAAAKQLSFTGASPAPFLPSPVKLTESASALLGLIAIAASTIASSRYKMPYQHIAVNTDIASLSLFSVILPRIANHAALDDARVCSRFAESDLHRLAPPIRALSTNLYQTRDKAWYYLHGDLNPDKTMRMLGVADNGEKTWDEAVEVYKEKVGEWDGAALERVANEELSGSGVVCQTYEEFVASQTGKCMSGEPLYTLAPVRAPRSSWPAPAPGGRESLQPLAGIRVVDFSRVIAAPVISKTLALLGADVVKIGSKKLPDHGFLLVDLNMGKRDADVDLKSAEGREVFSTLLKDADVLVDGYRPGTLEKLGFDAQTLRRLNPQLIIVRENCYGWKGPLAHRSGWQPISDCLVGHAWLQGRFLGLDEPVLPPLPNSDTQTGYAGAAATLQALFLRTQSAVTFTITTSLTQYNTFLYALGPYTTAQQTALRQLNFGFTARHTDTVQMLLAKTHEAVRRTRPDLFEHPEWFWTSDGRLWGVSEGVEVLGSAFRMEVSKLGYGAPSGPRGSGEAVFL